MSIDATIVGVTVIRQGDDQGAFLNLGPRDPHGTSPGQIRMKVCNPPDPPERLECLLHCEIWGGDSDIMLGDERLAHREGYTRLHLVDGWPLVVKEWHDKRERKRG